MKITSVKGLSVYQIAIEFIIVSNSNYVIRNRSSMTIKEAHSMHYSNCCVFYCEFNTKNPQKLRLCVGLGKRTARQASQKLSTVSYAACPCRSSMVYVYGPFLIKLLMRNGIQSWTVRLRGNNMYLMECGVIVTRTYFRKTFVWVINFPFFLENYS